MNKRLSFLLVASSSTLLLVAACTETPASPLPGVDNPIAPASDDDDDVVDAAAKPPVSTPASKGDASVPDAASSKPKEKSDSGPPVQSTCCTGKGMCVPSSAVPAEAASKLKPDTCSAENVCIPTEMIAGGKDFVPPACEVNSIGMKGAGVCLSDCLDMGQMGAMLKQGSCQADHKCAPCKVFGQATGLPGCPAE